MLPNVLLLLWVALPLFAFPIARGKSRKAQALVMTITMGAGYILLVVAAGTGGEIAHAAMMRHDLNGDGIVSGAERSQEAEGAIREWASDTGVTMAPIVGLPLTVIWYSILFLVLFGGVYLLKRLFPSIET